MTKRVPKEEVTAIVQATIAKIRADQQTANTVAEDLLADIVRKATPYGVQDGDFIASYILPTGPIHKAIAYLNERGIPRFLDVPPKAEH